MSKRPDRRAEQRAKFLAWAGAERVAKLEMKIMALAFQVGRNLGRFVMRFRIFRFFIKKIYLPGQTVNNREAKK